MSAEANVNTEAVDNGPVIITVIGQEGHAPVAEVKTETTEEISEVVEEVKKEAAGSEEQVEGERDDKGRFKPNAQARIAQLTAARREAERKAEYWENVAQGKVAPPTQTEQPVVAEAKQPPTRDQFTNDADYLEALTDHKVDMKLAQREQQAQQVKAQTVVADSWQSKLVEARESIPDFDSVMDSAELVVAGHVAGLLMQHEQGAKIAHHFASNPEELAKVNEMAPAQAAFAIADVGARFKSPDSTSSSKPAAVVKKVSEAPPPAARNVGSGRSTTVPLGEMSMDDYVATRKAQGAAWAR
jgi:hypothetical protein